MELGVPPVFFFWDGRTLARVGRGDSSAYAVSPVMSTTVDEGDELSSMAVGAEGGARGAVVVITVGCWVLVLPVWSL